MSSMNLASQLRALQALIASTGPLYNMTLHLSSYNGTVDSQTTLADLLAAECVFQGYAEATGVTPTGTYTSGGQANAAFDSYLFEATNGITQQMTNLTVGPITVSGAATATITAAGMTGSPKVVNVPILAGDTNAAVAAKFAAALAADPNVGAWFTVSSSGNVVYLTAKNPAANDPTMNAAFATGTATGLTAEPTATQTRAGSAPVALNDSITAWFLTDPSNTVLLLCEPVVPAVPIVSAGQGFNCTPDYAYPGSL